MKFPVLMLAPVGGILQEPPEINTNGSRKRYVDSEKGLRHKLTPVQTYDSHVQHRHNKSP
jgi:hypothetical protein